MSRSERLFSLIETLHDGDLHRAVDLARTHGVTVRTIYRDMDTLRTSGVPVRGTPGTGYRADRQATLPSLTLSDAELEALQLGIAIVGEAADPDLRAAAERLGARIDEALTARPAPQDWMLATYPFADAARGLAHLTPLRAALRGRQKLRVAHLEASGAERVETLRPLQVEHWGRIWMLTAWSEDRDGFCTLRVDLIRTVTPLPELFSDEPGKRLEDAPGQAERASARS